MVKQIIVNKEWQPRHSGLTAAEARAILSDAKDRVTETHFKKAGIYPRGYIA